MHKKKIIVVGAGSGIGKALFERVRKTNDSDVYGLSRRGESFSNKFQSGLNYRCDVTNEGDIHNFFYKYQESNKTLDALFLCQGDGLFGEIEKIDRLSLEKHFQLNLFSQFSILQFAYPLLRISDHPFVCFLSSTAGKVGFPESTAYCASKHAVAGLAKSLREEWKKDNIRVMTVYPGAISTSIWEGREGFDQNDMIAPEDFAEYLASFITLPKTINLDESYVLPQKGIL